MEKETKWFTEEEDICIEGNAIDLVEGLQEYIEEFGKENVRIVEYSDYDNRFYSIEVLREETDKEFNHRMAMELAIAERKKLVDLKILAELKAKYGDV